MKTVLLVDDDSLTRELLSRVLELSDLECEVLVVESGLKALKMIGDHNIDVLVTDLSMPEMDGIELMAKVKEVQPDLPILVMSGVVEEYAAFVEQMGASRFLSKPIDTDRFLSALRDVFSDVVGDVATLSAQHLLQFVSSERKSCVLTVKGKDQNGSFYFVDGNMIEAKTDSQSGLDAVYEMFEWDIYLFTVNDLRTPVACAIDKDLTQILLDWAMTKDNESRGDHDDGADSRFAGSGI